MRRSSEICSVEELDSGTAALLDDSLAVLS